MHEIIHSKFTQSVTAFFTSFLASLVHASSDELIIIGQLITIYGGILIGMVRFFYWLKDRNKSEKDPKK